MSFYHLTTWRQEKYFEYFNSYLKNFSDYGGVSPATPDDWNAVLLNMCLTIKLGLTSLTARLKINK